MQSRLAQVLYQLPRLSQEAARKETYPAGLWGVTLEAGWICTTGSMFCSAAFWAPMTCYLQSHVSYDTRTYGHSTHASFKLRVWCNTQVPQGRCRAPAAATVVATCTTWFGTAGYALHIVFPLLI